MSKEGVEALRRLRDQALEIGRSLSATEWDEASACAGWSVRDVYAHMGGLMHGIVDPSFMRAGDDPDDVEGSMEVGVAERREWSVADVLAEYEQYSAAVADLMAGMQDPPVSENLLPLGGLGTHPMHVLVNAFVFDHYCHLRDDVLRPYGPIDREPPAASAENLGPVVEWMLAGLPQMCAAAFSFVDRPIELRLEGPGGDTFTVAPGEAAPTISPGAAAGPAAVVVSGTDEFVRWATRRRAWRDEGVVVTGDEAYGAAFCDACNVI